MSLHADLATAAGGGTPSARLQGDLWRFKGMMTATAAVSANSLLWTLPIATPSASDGAPFIYYNSGLCYASQLSISSGVVQSPLQLPSGCVFGLSGIEFSLD